MHDTLPPILSVWSGLAAPMCCLANKSQARLCSESLQSALEANLSGPGSMIYQTVWKPHVTPLGRQIYRLRASARRTSDSEPSLVPSGWPSPGASDGNGGKGPRTGVSMTGRMPDGSKVTMGLPATAKLALSGWPTPNAVNGDRTAYKDFDKLMARKAAGRQTNLQEIVMVRSGWATPSVRDYKDTGDLSKSMVRKDGKMRHDTVARQAWLTANPQAARITADGTMLTGCSAGMESGGQLNPAFSAWLMGFPEAWCHAAISCQLPIRSRKAPKKPAA